jgi:hypothetical protein
VTAAAVGCVCPLWMRLVGAPMRLGNGARGVAGLRSIRHRGVVGGSGMDGDGSAAPAAAPALLLMRGAV